MPTRRAAGKASFQGPTQLESYVLHSWDWSESSLIVELFTRERGRLTVVAKGAKRPTSQLRAVLLPFQPIQAQLSKTRADDSGEIHLLRHAEWQGGGPVLPPAALFQGFYLNELLMKLLARHDPHALLFDAYVHSLPALAHGDELLAQAGLRAFELVLLRESGVLPDLSRSTLAQAALQASESYALRPESGLVKVVGDEPALKGQQWLRLHEALGADSMSQLHSACATGLSALKPLLRTLLHYHLGSSTLRTRQVMHSVQRLLDSASAANARL